MLFKKNKYSDLGDEELMLHICDGETGAFDELYKRYGKRLLSYFMRMLNYDKSIAEDALQDTFMKVAEKPESFDGSRSFKTWIFSIASNYCKNVYRHEEVVRNSKQELAYTACASDDFDLKCSTQKLDGFTFRQALDQVLDELAPERKEAFILRYQEDRSIQEIAQIQNCPEGSVKSRLHYTLKILEEKLQHFKP